MGEQPWISLYGRVAVITGSSVGIGSEMAKVSAGEGVQTVVIARWGALLKTLQEEVVAAGGRRPLALDVTGAKTPQALVARLCSPKARYITGERIHVDGGLRRAY